MTSSAKQQLLTTSPRVQDEPSALPWAQRSHESTSRLLSTAVPPAALCGLLIALAALALPFVGYYGVRAAYVLPINYNEGWNVIHTARVLAGQPIYVPIGSLPLIPVNYLPGAFVIPAAVSLLAGDVLLTGRLLSLAALLVIAGLVCLAARELTRSTLAALFAPLVWLALMVRFAPHYVGVFDPQLLAHCFALLGLYLYLKHWRQVTWLQLTLIAAFCCLAILIKHLVVAVPVAIALSLLFWDRRKLPYFVVIQSGLVAAGGLGIWAYGGPDALSNFIDTSRPISTAKLLWELEYLFVQSFAAVTLIPFFLVWRDRPAARPVVVYGGIACLLGLATIGGVGVAINAWFDLFIASALAVSLLAAQGQALLARRPSDQARAVRLPRGHALCALLALVGLGLLVFRWLFAAYVPRYPADGNLRLLVAATILAGIAGLGLWLASQRSRPYLQWLAVYAVLASLLLPALSLIRLRADEVRSFQNLAVRQQVYRDSIEFLRASPGPALYEDMLLGALAGKPFQFDPFNGSQLMVAGRVDEGLIVDALRQGCFGTIALRLDLESRRDRLLAATATADRPRASISDRWTDSSLRTIYEEYQLVHRSSDSYSFFYQPKHAAGRDCAGFGLTPGG